jgi:flagellar hook assembly protein FlgD
LTCASIIAGLINAQLADSGAPYLLDAEIFKPGPVTTSIHTLNTGVNPAANSISFVQTGRNAYRIQLGDNNTVLEIRIADSKGRIIASWSQDKLAGRNSIEWNATDAYGRAVGKGVYFVNVICKNTSISKAVIVL